MRMGFRNIAPTSDRPPVKTHRVLALLVLVPIVVAAHALGAVTLSDLGHGGLPSGQPVSFALGGLLLIALIAKVMHLVGIGALGAGLHRLRKFLTNRRRAAVRPLKAETDSH